MNKYKRLYLLLFCSLVLLNGFSPVVSYAAYDDNGELHIQMRGLSYYFGVNGLYGTSEFTYNSNLDYYVFPSVSLNSVDKIVLKFDSDILYFPELYDYYLLVTMYSDVAVSKFSFAPDTFSVQVYNCDGGNNYILSDVNYYHHDFVTDFTGFTITGKIPDMNSTAISYIEILDPSSGSVPSADMNVKIHVLKVEKNSNSNDLSLITKKLDDINNSINKQGADIHEAMNELQQTIEDQYSVSEEENFGVDDIVDQVNEKAGVLSFGTDTLVNFLDLFNAANATNTQLTFPGFSMEVQGVTYQVWPDYHYDLSELENQFGALIEVVRWGCVMAVWLAVLNYLVKAYDSIFGR